MNDAKRSFVLFILVISVAVAAFLGIVALAIVSCLSSGSAARGLQWTGIVLSAIYLAAGATFLIFGFRRKKS